MGLASIQVEQVGGKHLFRNIIINLPKIRNYSSLVRSIGIVRDADKSCNDTFQSVQGALRDAHLPVPDQPITPVGTNPRVAVFITPDNSGSGALEDLLMASTEGDPVLSCVDQYFDCLRSVQGTEHPHLSKAYVQVYLAKEPDGDIHMGIASKQDVWNWASPAFDALKTFINSL
jgi:hypothetical protein